MFTAIIDERVPGFEPIMTKWEVRTLPLCYDTPFTKAFGSKPVASIIKFTTSNLRRCTELSRHLWMLSTDTSFDLYDGVKTTS